jgi:hypothetical protein
MKTELLASFVIGLVVFGLIIVYVARTPVSPVANPFSITAHIDIHPRFTIIGLGVSNTGSVGVSQLTLKLSDPSANTIVVSPSFDLGPNKHFGVCLQEQSNGTLAVVGETFTSGEGMPSVSVSGLIQPRAGVAYVLTVSGLESAGNRIESQLTVVSSAIQDNSITC